MKILRRLILITVLLLTAVLVSLSQDKKALSVTDIMKFRQVQSPTISNDGKWVTHAAIPDRGDPEVLVYSSDGKTNYTIQRGEKPVISNDGQWISAAHAIPADELQKSEVKSKSDDEKGPKAGLILLNTSSGEQQSFENIKSFEFSNDSKWLLYHDASNTAKDTSSNGGDPSKTGDNPGSQKKNMGTPLTILSLDEGSSRSFPFVTKFAMDTLSGFLAFVVKDSSGAGNGVHMLDLSDSTNEPFPVFTDSSAWADYLTWNNRSGELAFLAGMPGKKDQRQNAQLYIWSPGEEYSKAVLEDEDLTGDWKIYHTNKLQWSKDGNRLFLGIKPASEIITPEEEKNDSLWSLYDMESILSNRALDVWHWNDPYINSNQKIRWKEEKDRTYTGVYYPEKGDFIPLADPDVPELRISESTTCLLGSSNVPYARRVTWDGRISDYYLVDLTTGDKKLAVKEQRQTVRLSPDGKYLVYYRDGDWDYSEKYQFRIERLDPENRYLETGETCFLTAYHDTRKFTALYSMKAGNKGVTKIVEEPKKYTLIAKSKDADKVLFSRESYTEFPDLWVTDLKFRNPVKLSDVNPRIAEFAWGDAELVEWTSLDGIPIQGILIKPGNYESGKKYPVLVYYYRFFSNRLFEFNQVAINHRPCFPFYASNGYAIFLPDIRFDIGNPGYSATKCLVPGVQKIINMGVADPDGICLHGHSWSGYQTAFAITQTDIFTCAIAGAPVSNMTSAYSGIRWETGLARQFQYEKSQSRIGGSLWEARDKYIENSPVFFADRINTPLLIQFGDEDGAVPWYQGIELYLAMRRLQKDCVFLQYRGEPHHLKIYANKLDYTLKFKAYLDHYLKGEPAPEWLETGVPYKGK